MRTSPRDQVDRPGVAWEIMCCVRSKTCDIRTKPGGPIPVGDHTRWWWWGDGRPNLVVDTKPGGGTKPGGWGVVIKSDAGTKPRGYQTQWGGLNPGVSNPGGTNPVGGSNPMEGPKPGEDQTRLEDQTRWGTKTGGGLKPAGRTKPVEGQNPVGWNKPSGRNTPSWVDLTWWGDKNWWGTKPA